MTTTNTKINITQAQDLLNTLVHKDISLSCGYGGVMFVEIGNIISHEFEYEEGKKTTRKFGDYRLFCDENWNFCDGKDINIDRFTSSSKEVDDLFESLGTQKIEKIEVINNFEKTIFYISGGYKFTILKDDAIDTFSISMIPENKKLAVFGNGEIELKDYVEDKWYLKEKKPRPARTDTVTIDRGFLREQSADLLPLSLQKAKEFINIVLNKKVTEITVDSGTRFTMSIEDETNKLGKINLSIDDLWLLKKEKEILIDVSVERFKFENNLKNLILNKKILDIKFEDNGNNLTIIFEDNLSLTILETNRYSRWSMHNFSTGIMIYSIKNEGLEYRISSPAHLSNKYKTGDIHLDAILYELEFYRNYFSS